MTNLYSLIIKYEVKSFFNYLRQKNERVLGFIASVGVFALIMYFSTTSIITLLSMAPDTSGIRKLIVDSLPLVVMSFSILALISGFSLATTIGRRQRKKINLMLTAPTKPQSVIRAYIVLDGLSIMLLYIVLFYPSLYTFLVYLEFNVARVAMFMFLLTLYVVAFATIGTSLGIIFIRISHKYKLKLAVIATLIGAYVYARVVTLQNVPSREIGAIVHIIGGPYSPFSWPVSLILESNIVSISIKLVGSIIFIVGSLWPLVNYVTEAYLTGKIREPKKAFVRRARPGGILYRLFDRQTAGIVRKDVRMISRDPAMLSSILFSLVMVFFLLNFNIPADAPKEELVPIIIMIMNIMLTVVVFVGVAAIVPTSLALERRNMGLLLSSPVDPKKIIRAKLSLSELLFYLAMGIIVPVIVVRFPETLTYIGISILLAIDMEQFAAGLSSYVAVKYTDFKAENPRKALKTGGAIIMGITMMVMIFVVIFVSLSILLLNQITLAIGGLVLFLVVGWLVRRYLLGLASNILKNLEATEYL